MFKSFTASELFTAEKILMRTIQPYLDGPRPTKAEGDSIKEAIMRNAINEFNHTGIDLPENLRVEFTMDFVNCKVRGFHWYIWP